MNPSQDEVREQLARILGSPAFAASERLSRFLRYVVERTCAGEGDRLKEFVVGTEVFDRDDRYDPRVDSVVRVEAGRLRSRLAEYYAGQGAGDPIVIRVPRGGYAPVFERREPAPSRVPWARPPRRLLFGAVSAFLLLAAAVALRLGLGHTTPVRATRDVRIAVIPFVGRGNDEGSRLLAARMTEGVNHELVRLGTFQVVAHGSVAEAAARGVPVTAIARSLRADVLVEASVAEMAQRVTVEAVLVDVAAESKFWIDEFTGPAADLGALQARLAAAAARAVAGHRSGAYWTRP